MPSDPKKPRGLAALSPERRREIAAMGGRTSQANGTAHVFTSDDAPVYGHKGAITRWHGKVAGARVVTKAEDE